MKCTSTFGSPCYRSILNILFVCSSSSPKSKHKAIPKPWCLKVTSFLVTVPGDGGSQVEAKLNKDRVVHYLCEKTTQDFFNIWLNMELLVPWVIDCWVSKQPHISLNCATFCVSGSQLET